MALCSRCRKHPPKPGQRYCGECRAAYMREWRKATRLTAEQRRWVRNVFPVKPVKHLPPPDLSTTTDIGEAA